MSERPWETQGGSSAEKQDDSSIPDWMTSDGGIPVDPGALPIDSVVLEESLIYDVTLKRVTLSGKLSKGGLMYIAVGVEVSGGKYEGASLTQHYLPLPYKLKENATRADVIKLHNDATQFARFASCFKFKGTMPRPALEPTRIAELQNFFSQFYGNAGKITVKNEEFPEGSGRMRSAPADYLVM